jgi:DNA primase
VEIPHLHPDTIEEVKQRADIVDIISDYVVLRKRGKDYLGLCPFHQEKTPSFSVSQDKQLYYCFGCGAGGNSFKFLMEIGKQSFASVVLDLAKRYQIPVKTVEPQQRQEIQRQLSLRDELYQIIAVTASFYEYALRQSQGEIALNYLVNTRKLTESTITEFQLGYAPAGWETLYRYLVEQKRYSVNLVEEAGLIKKRKSGSGYYDVFRDRITIPIKDTQGRIIAFGSRTLNDEEQPKYLNSPETPLFDKSKTLYALDKAGKNITTEDRAIIVEGYFDVIALHAVGIKNVVASLGTALTNSQIKQLLRYTPSKQIILNFDADNAGAQATQRAIAEIEDLVYSGVVQLKILNLPDGKDADEFVRNTDNSVETYHKATENAPLWLDWQINKLLSNWNIKTADGLQQIAQGMVRLLNRLQNINLLNYYLDRCAELLSQGDARLITQNLASLKSQLKNKSAKRPERSEGSKSKARSVLSAAKDLSQKFARQSTINNQQSTFQVAVSPETDLLQQAEALLLRIYLHCPNYRQVIIETLEAKDLLFSLHHYRFLWQQIMEVEDKLKSSGDGEVVEMKKYSTTLNNNYLLMELQNRSLNFPETMREVSQLFYLNEKTQEDIFRAKGRIEEAIASLELVNCKKYELYCNQQLHNRVHNQDLAKDAQQLEYYVQEIQNTRKRISELETIRLATARNL